MDPLKVYNLGQLGVQLVASPLHQKPASEVLRAQNAIFDKNVDAGGLTKRGGFAKVNAAALNSGAAIKGGLFAAFPDPTTPFTSSNKLRRGFYLVPFTVTQDAIYSTNPTDWSGEIELIANEVQPASGVPFGPDLPFPFGISLPGRIYYRGVGSGSIRAVHKWDGDADAIIAMPGTPPQTGAGAWTDMVIPAIHIFDGKIYICTNDSSVSSTRADFGRVFELNIETEDLEQIGTSTWGTHAGGLLGGIPAAMAFFEGALYVATSTMDSSVAPRVYSIRPGVDEDWTLEDNTAGAGLTYTGLHVYRGDLYASTRSLSGGTASILRKRSNGTWSAAKTNASTTVENSYLGMGTLGSTMYVVERDKSAANDALVIYTYDGTTFTSSRTIRASDYAGTATGKLHISGAVVHDNAIYWSSYMTLGTGGDVGNVLHRHDGSTWTAPRSRLNTAPDITEDIFGVLRD